MPASNKYSLAARQAAARKAGNPGTLAYKASMQASLRSGKNLTKTSTRAEVRELSRPQRSAKEQAKHDRYERRVQQAQQDFASSIAPVPGQINLYVYDDGYDNEYMIFLLFLERTLQVKGKVGDSPEARDSGIRLAQENAGKIVEINPKQTARVFYARACVKPAGTYPGAGFINPEERGKPLPPVHIPHEFVEVEVWVELKGKTP